MMKGLFIFSTIFFMSCANIRPLFFTHSKSTVKQNWIEHYKTIGFCYCLKSGYGNDTIYKKIQESDVVFIGSEGFIMLQAEIRALSEKVVEKIPTYQVPDWSTGDFHLKKVVLKTCLEFYESKELQRFAQKKYKESLHMFDVE